MRRTGGVSELDRQGGMMKRGGVYDGSPSSDASVNNERIVTVSNRRHSGLDAILFALLQEHPTNFRILILVFDQRAAFA